MLDAGFFVSDTIHPRKVKLPDGSEHELHFRELPAAEFRRFQIAERSENEDERIASIPKLIVASLCDPDGKPAITVKQAMKLKAAAMNELMNAVMDVNGKANKGND